MLKLNHPPDNVQTEMSVEFSKQLTDEQLAKIVNKHPLGLGKPEDVAYSAAFSYYLQYSRGELRYHLIGNIGLLIILLPSTIFAA